MAHLVHNYCKDNKVDEKKLGWTHDCYISILAVGCCRLFFLINYEIFCQIAFTHR